MPLDGNYLHIEPANLRLVRSYSPQMIHNEEFNICCPDQVEEDNRRNKYPIYLYDKAGDFSKSFYNLRHAQAKSRLKAAVIYGAISRGNLLWDHYGSFELHKNIELDLFGSKS